VIESADIACLVLASGSSSRFGSHKLLHELPDGISVIAKTIRLYKQVFNQVHVVIREGDHELTKIVEQESAICVLNNSAEQGLSQSVVAGVRSTTPITAWLCGLADMPYLSPDTVRSIAESVRSATIVAPKTLKGIGNPVALGVRFKQELLELDGDIGAKPILNRHSDLVEFHHCNDQGIHQDIDTVDDILPVTR